MENANKGFLPLNSSSPIKEEDEEVAYRENQAAGFIAKRPRLDASDESLLCSSLHSSCKMDTSSQLGSSLQSMKSPSTPPEVPRLRAITGRRDRIQDQQMAFMPFGLDEVSMSNFGPPSAWNRAQPLALPDVNPMALQYNPMLQSSLPLMNYVSQIPGYNPCQLPPPPNPWRPVGPMRVIPDEHYCGLKPGRECKFCKNNGEPIKEYRSHILRNPTTGALICPVLRGHICEVCGATGDFAHTRNYCPNLKNENRLSCAIPVSLKKTRRQSDGQLRG